MQIDWIQRYSYAVTKELPEAQRKDIDKELRGLIEDMLDERAQGRPASPEDVEAVLMELGDPAELAEKYRDRKRYLIGPALFPAYLTVVKIVMGAIAIAMAVLFVIRAVVDPQQSLDYLVQSLSTFVEAAFQGFTWVTLGFALSERFGKRGEQLDFSSGESWKLSDLPELPDERNRIPRAEPVVAIIFLSFFAALLISATDWLGVWFIQDGQPMLVVPLFDNPVLLSFLPWILGALLLDVVLEILKIVSGKWTLKLTAFDLFNNIVHLAVGLVVFARPVIWNPNLISDLVKASGVPAFDNFSAVWNSFTANLVYIIVLVFILECVGTVTRWRRLRQAD